MADEAGIVEIEAFRAGGKAARGISQAQLDEAIAVYNGETDPAPLVFGHPKSDAPAHGIIASLRREGNKLITGLKNISEDAIKGVKEGRFLNRSIAFWHPDHSANPTPGKWNIRHLGLLGAASPGIPGMSKLTFSADETVIESEEAPDTAVIFAEEPTATITITEGGTKVAEPKTDTVDKAEFDAAVAERDRLQKLVDDSAKAAETARKDANTAFVAELIKQGRVAPADKVLFTEILNRLPVEEVSFDADRSGDLVTELKKVLSAAEPRIIFEAISPKGGSEGEANLNVDQITAKANQLVKDGKATSFEAAVELIEQKGA